MRRVIDGGERVSRLVDQPPTLSVVNAVFAKHVNVVSAGQCSIRVG